MRLMSFSKSISTSIMAVGVLFLLALSGCGEGEKVETKGLLRPGVVALLRAFDRNYEYELQRVDGGLTSWDVIWEGQSVAQRNYYRGLFTVMGTSSTNRYVNEIDEKKIDALFPMAVGKETSFFGKRNDLASGETLDFWTYYSVLEKTSIEISNGRYEVYVVQMITETKTPSGTQRNVRKLWYSPALEFTLRGWSDNNGQTMDWIVTGFTTTSKASRRRVGTVMI